MRFVPCVLVRARVEAVAVDTDEVAEAVATWVAAVEEVTWVVEAAVEDEEVTAVVEAADFGEEVEVDVDMVVVVVIDHVVTVVVLALRCRCCSPPGIHLNERIR